jgi:hypothetical protein
LGQTTSTGNVIRLNMSVNDILDLHPLCCRKFDVGIDVIGLWVHDRGPCLTGSTKDVSGTAGVLREKLFEDHLKVGIDGFSPVTIIACDGNLI